MRFEVNIPDNTPPDLAARLDDLLRRLSAQPELVDDIDLGGDDRIQGMFSPSRLAHIDAALKDIQDGNHLTQEQLERHFKRKASS